jgi:asparagine synthase (glutamine-hydrolysing)
LQNHRSLRGVKAFLYFLLPVVLKNQFFFMSKNHLDRGFCRRHADRGVITRHLYGSPTLLDALLNHFEYKFEHHLMWGDRSSMWFSMELRFPFLDYRMVEGSLALQNRQKIRRGTTKYILRQAMAGLVPDRIRLRQDKVGFETPESVWFRQPPFTVLIRDILESPSFAHRGYFDLPQARRLYQAHCAGQCNASPDIWKWINLELWFNKFIDGSGKH